MNSGVGVWRIFLAVPQPGSENLTSGTKSWLCFEALEWFAKFGGLTKWRQFRLAFSGSFLWGWWDDAGFEQGGSVGVSSDTAIM